jgi:hypothetical protein
MNAPFDGKEFGEELTEIIKSYVARAVKPLEDRIAQLEARGEVKMCGVWLQDCEYETGNLAIYNGSLWCAKARTKSRPGSDSSWQLQIKQGTFSK